MPRGSVRVSTVNSVTTHWWRESDSNHKLSRVICSWTSRLACVQGCASSEIGFIGFWVLNIIFQIASFLMTTHYTSEWQYSPGYRSLSTQPHSASSRRMRGNIKYNQHAWYGLFLYVVLTWLWQPPPSTVHSESSLVARASTPFCCFSKNRELFYRQRTMLEAIQSNLYTGLLLFPVSCLVISATLGWCLQGRPSGSGCQIMLC